MAHIFSYLKRYAISRDFKYVDASGPSVLSDFCWKRNPLKLFSFYYALIRLLMRIGASWTFFMLSRVSMFCFGESVVSLKICFMMEGEGLPGLIGRWNKTDSLKCFVLFEFFYNLLGK